MGRQDRRRNRLVMGMLLLIVLIMASSLQPGRASAHPLGNFAINRYSRIEVSAQQIHIFYVLDMAEIPAFQERELIDHNGDGKVDDSEAAAYLARKLPELLANLHLTLKGDPVPLTASSPSPTLSFPPGQGGLMLLRLTATFEAAPPIGTGHAIEAGYRDDNYADRLGWKEIVVQASQGAAIQHSSVSAQDVSHELRSYPTNLLSSPLDIRAARFGFTLGAASGGAEVGTTQAAAQNSGRLTRAIGVADGAFASLVTSRALTLPIVIFALFAAMALGALHALSPGHGKTIAAAYLVSSRATSKHALFLGLTVTATHTSSVFLLGLITLTASQFILPERLYPILNLASGLIIIGIGGFLSVTRGRRVVARVLQSRRQAAPAPDRIDAPAVSPASQLVLAGASRTALAGEREVFPDRSPAHFAAAGHVHAGRDAHSLHHHGPGSDVEHGHPHLPSGSDGEHGHSHLPPGADGQPTTWRSVLALGISGGLLPCPSALVVLLSAIALHRLQFGLLLIVAFSVGLAAALVGIGMLLLYARHLFARFGTEGGLMQALPVVSAVLITAAGLVITAAALGVRGLPPI